MKNRKFFSLFAFGFGIISSSVIFFADTLGLDANPGWSRVRFGAFILCVLIATISGGYLIVQPKVERRIASFVKVMEGNLFGSRLLSFWRAYSFTFPISLLVLLIYIWFVSAGTWTSWVSPTRYYASLARGFELGNLFMATVPDEGLATLSNPYDPAQRTEVEVPVDVSYYNGRYYLYWGPAPALLLVPIQMLLNTRIGDLQLTFLFTYGVFLFLSATLMIIWNTYFLKLPKWLLGVSIVFIGVANPSLFMLNNFKGARIYEAAIASGQFFLIGGILFTCLGLLYPAKRWNFFAAGVLWSLAIGSRLILIAPIGIMSLILTAYWIREKENFFKKTFTLGIPLLFGIMAIGWYNWVRFGSLTESGMYYALAGVNLQKNYDLLFSTVYILQNLYNYLLYPFQIESQFPFIFAKHGEIQSVTNFITLPSFYHAQQITGLFFSVPFVCFSWITYIEWQKQPLRLTDTMNQITALLTGSWLVAFILLLFFFWSAMRYQYDFMPSLLMLSIIGWWQGYQRAQTNIRKYKTYLTLSILLMLLSIALSLLIALSTNDARFLLINAFTSIK